ncbi:MAG TPA: DUF2846 domain-containing protein [Burkholderiales bacterium]|nr:DUF2846 domain-containing protein [Burkholderiales bacterium]
MVGPTAVPAAARRLLGAVGVAALLALQGCATVKSLTGSESNALPPVPQGKGRIVFYRTNFALETQVPAVVLNGERIGKPLHRGVFFRDVAPGSYAVTTTIASDIVNFRVNAGERVYVKLNPGWGFRIAPLLVEPATGEAESSGMTLVQPSPK